MCRACWLFQIHIDGEFILMERTLAMKQTPKFLLPLLLASLAALQGCSSVYRDTVSAPTEQEIAAAKLMEPDPVLRQGEFHMQRVNEGSTVRIEPKIKLKHPELPPFDVAYVSQPVEDILIELANTAGHYRYPLGF